MTVEAFINECVGRRGISVAKLARRCQMEPELLRRSLAEQRIIKGDELVRLCVELDLDIKDFAPVLEARKEGN